MYLYRLFSICRNSSQTLYKVFGSKPDKFNLITGNILLPFFVTIISFVNTANFSHNWDSSKLTFIWSCKSILFQIKISTDWISWQNKLSRSIVSQLSLKKSGNGGGCSKIMINEGAYTQHSALLWATNITESIYKGVRARASVDSTAKALSIGGNTATVGVRIFEEKLQTVQAF